MAPNNTSRVGFIGAGMMASAMMKGFLANKVASQVYASDIAPGSKEKVESFGAVFAASNAEIVTNCDVIFLAVKPGIVPIVLQEISTKVNQDQLIISIAAGVTIESIESKLPKSSKVVRVMPNTPCLVGEMAAGFAAGTNATKDDMKYVESILNTMGTAISCAEKDLNAITGLSGSGPAYIFLLIEALADGGVLAGLPRQTAQKLAAQTVKGAAEMVLKTGTHPGVLKDQVCSPGGTTIAGVEALENKGFRSALISAVKAAKLRGDELSRNKM